MWLDASLSVTALNETDTHTFDMGPGVFYLSFVIWSADNTGTADLEFSNDGDHWAVFGSYNGANIVGVWPAPCKFIRLKCTAAPTTGEIGCDLLWTK